MTAVDILIYLINQEVITMDRVPEKYKADVSAAFNVGGQN